jgi:CxxC motif-containing protein
MKKQLELICIECPKGCRLLVTEDLTVTGYDCPRGLIYGKNEATKPMRLIASTVKINSGILKRLPVATSGPIPKKYIFDIIKQINQLDITPPVHCRQILIENVFDLGVDIIATRTITK